MKPIIVTGLSGMVGSRLRDMLGNQYDLIDVSLPKYDILDKKKIKEVFKLHDEARYVLHLAAFTDVGKAWEERGNKGGACYRVNVLGTKNIAELCNEFQKHLIYVSTDFVFDGKKKGAYTEKDKPNPIEWYGETKYLGEKIVSKTVANWAIARIAFPYRAHFPAKKDLVRRLIEGFEEKKLYPMFADQITTPTFTDEIIRALGAMMIRRSAGIHHLVGSSSQSPYELALTIADVFGLDKKLVKKGSLAEYAKKQPKDSRPWHQSLAISNEATVKKLGVNFSALKEGLEKLKSQMSK